MFKKIPSAELVQLNEAIDDVFSELKGLNSDTEDYDRASDQLIKLIKLKEEMTSGSKISAETLAGIAANLGGILLILNFERTGVVASKALGFVSKFR